MQSAKLIARENTSDAVAIHIRNMIVDGDLPAGERINEVHLSQDLGVSRTPLREALARLAHEGALETVPRIGHFVRPLSVAEVDQLYDLRPLLDPHALRLAGIPSRQRLDRLREMNEDLAAIKEPDALINADDEWHLELIAECPNQILIDLIKQFMRRTRRYEIALMREKRHVTAATSHHRTIISALKRGDMNAACNALAANLEQGKKPIVEWLTHREAQAKKSR